MQFRVIVGGDDATYEVEQTTPLAVNGIFELESGTKVRAVSISYDPVGSPGIPDMLIHAARAA